MPTIDATVAGVSSNSYTTLAEANIYFDERLPLPTAWVGSGDLYVRALIMATRVLDSFVQPRKRLSEGYYVTSRQWTGSPATITQRLAWPRTGMVDANGNTIPSNIIPQALKDAQAELAGQLLIADTTLDNDVIVSGIKSVSAGSVSVTFKDMIERHVLPDSVWNLMPASWFTDELYEPALRAMFDVVSE